MKGFGPAAGAVIMGLLGLEDPSNHGVRITVHVDAVRMALLGLEAQ